MITLLKRYPALRRLLQLALAVALWLAFAPQQIGGQVTYVILSGNSMTPAFQRGDLVLVRQQADYQVGEAVAYHHPLIGLVFHRIVDQQDSGFILKGDHNTWNDSYQPAKSEVVGRLWLKVPLLGKLITALRSPQWLALFSLGAGTAVAATVVDSRVQPRQKRKARQAKTRQRRASEVPIRPQDLLTALALITLGIIVLLIVSFSRPAFVDVTELVPYQHNIEFNYASLAPGNLYDNAVVQPGEPIFRRLTDNFSVSFVYHIQSTATVQHVSGTARVLLVLSESNGWKRTMELEAPTEFEGDRVELSTTIHLSDVQTSIDLFENETGMAPNQYTLSVQPQVSVSGLVGVSAFVDEFTPSLDFLLNDLQVRLLGDNGSAVESLDQSKASAVTIQTSQDNTISFFGNDLKVTSVRLVGLIFFAVFGCATLITALHVRHLANQAEDRRIQSFYGPAIVPVHGFKFEYLGSLAEVNSIEDLLRLAEESGNSILYEKRGELHHYFLSTERILYHYQCQTGVELS